jgi:hypothetical protein
MHVIRINECITYLCSDFTFPHGFFKKIGCNKKGLELFQPKNMQVIVKQYTNFSESWEILQNPMKYCHILQNIGAFLELFEPLN